MNHHCSNSKALSLKQKIPQSPLQSQKKVPSLHKYNLLLNKRKEKPLCTKGNPE